MKKMLIFLIGLLVVLAIWMLVGYFGSNVEQVKYKVVEEAEGYEIREYPEYIVAQTEVTGSKQEALNKGFSILAKYIFGANSTESKITMTTPVVSKTESFENIAMTAPVVTEQTSPDTYIVTFSMPSKYTLETLPTPLDDRIKLVKVPTKKMAVLRFSGFRTDERVKEKEDLLAKLLTENKVGFKSAPIYAGYNPPLTPPWMTRHEVMFELN